MSLILGIDCCTGWTNAGLADNGVPVGEINLNIGRKQAGILPGMVSDLLSFYGYGLDDVKKISVTSGPGYFTGIRIGMTYASSLAYSLGVDVISLSSLETLIPLNHPCDIPALSLLPMGKKKIFAALYDVTSQGNLSKIREPGIFTPEEMSCFIDNQDFELLCYTSQPEIAESILKPVRSLKILFSLTGGLNVAVGGFRKLAESASPEYISPNYMALPQTE